MNDRKPFMLSSLRKIFSDPPRQHAHEAYLAIVAQSRKPFFYKECGIADSIDGRFDVIVLHLFLLIHRLRGELAGTGTAGFIRLLTEVFFADMDRSLREMGVGDTGVGSRIKKMVEAFYGRLQVYERSLGKPEHLKESLQRNLYRETPVDEAKLTAVTAYVLRNAAYLTGQESAAILNGAPRFLD